MRNRKPLVSIGLPTYNGERFIRQTLESLLAQDYENFELIISDNASTDKTPEICKEYASKDQRIKYFRNERNLGAIPNVNRVIELSSGEFFMLASDHDLWDKSFISKCVNVLTENPSIVLCFSKTYLIDSNGQILKIIDDERLDTRQIDKTSLRFHKILWEMTLCNIIYGIIKKEALKKTRLFIPTIGPDNLLLAELSLIGKFAIIPEPLYYRRLNRPPEDEKNTVQRYLRELHPYLKKNYIIRNFPYSYLMYQHLISLKRSQISSLEKIALSIDVILYFILWYKVLKEIGKGLPYPFNLLFNFIYETTKKLILSEPHRLESIRELMQNLLEKSLIRSIQQKK